MRHLSDLQTLNKTVKRENWEQVKIIFNRALAVAPLERKEFLDETCAGDKDLRRDVEILIASFDSTESFLENPAVEDFAELIDDSRPELQTGEIVAHYKILNLLGAGGMGEVYLAQDTKLNRRVALKFLPVEAINTESRKRFQREAQAAAALDHPHICAIYEISEIGRRAFIAMQYVEGETLAEKLKHRNLSLPETLKIAVQIADALTEAHLKGIVHRDIKPANVMVNSRGGNAAAVKVLDFGLAKYVSENKTIDSSLSSAGLIMGTAAYMSPEQARGQQVDERTDIWSLGVVLYEMISGKLPFSGETTSDVIASILKSDPAPLNDLAASIPGELQSIVSKAISKDISGRYASTAEMLADLQRVQKQTDSLFEHPTALDLDPASSPAASAEITSEVLANTKDNDFPYQTIRTKPRRRWLAPVFALAAVILAAAGYQFYFNKNTLYSDSLNRTISPATQTPSRRAVALVGFRDLSGRGENEWLSPALSEMLAGELAAGEKLRIVPQENVARMKSEISMTDADNITPEVLQKIWKNLNAELVISGSYIVLEDNKIRLDVRVLESVTGETSLSIAESGSKTELFQLVSRVGTRLRQALGAGSLNDADKNFLRASQPSTPEAAKLYAEGREKLNNFDFLPARDLLESAVAADPKFPLSHLSLAAALQKLGEDDNAKIESQKAFELSGSLPREERLTIEAFYHDIAGERDKAIEIYKTLFDFFPDNLEYGLRLASIQTRFGKADEAMATIESLRKLPVPVSEDPRIDIAEGDAVESLSDYKREVIVARSAAEKGLNRSSSLLAAEARYYEGWGLWNLGDNTAALAAYDEARRIYNEAGRRKSVADILNAAATVYWKQGEYDKALRIYEECLMIERETGSKIGAAAALNNIANIHKDRDELQNARRYYEEALTLEKEIGIKTRICVNVYNLAGVRRKQGDLAAAKNLYDQALSLARETGRKTTVTMVLQELAELAYYKNDLPAALNSATEALSVAREIKRRSSEAYALATLGQIALTKNDLAEAHQYLETSLDIRREIGEESEIAESQILLSKLALSENRAADALSLAQSAADIFTKLHACSSEADARAVIAAAHLVTGEIDSVNNDIEQAKSLSQKGENKLSRFFVRIIEARVLMATNRQTQAKQILREVISESNKLGFLNFALEAQKQGS